ncbi:hypothetical protein PN466_03045 [Roseofilum reptotaenium CS-1145]|uniref:Uncharacterized protein n=1 Tax=Roseofilum reptotaenium AO1-A TaxID=1925591 RepID=A0A1L9QJY2_9CYAN|nr:hypothetical protein [Roseofilum reptotaenium]MDB9515936.1 hypothetical protein [Roseofilum reptotaenium CS-1145]OJJ15244.1 hypothetical protein BI308_24395 [Roseofilum reptotaenium AO1-A]
MNLTPTQPLSVWIQQCWVHYTLDAPEERCPKVPELPGLYGLVAESQDGENWILLHIGQTQVNLRESWCYYRQLPMVKILHQLSLNVSLAVLAFPIDSLPGLSLEHLSNWEQALVESLEPMLTKTPAVLQIAVK